MDSAAREELARRSLAFSGADQTEVLVSSNRSALSRFTHNAIHQNVADADASISVRAIVGGRTGVARTNLQDEASLQACVKRAIDLAKLAPVDPDQRDLPSGGSPEAPKGAFETSTAQATPETRAGMCEKIFEVADAAELWSAGYATTAVHGITIANSRGALSSFDGTVAGINVKMNGRDSTGFAEAYDNAAQALDARAIAAVSAQKTRDSAN
ncbi:MAG: hypothetical protein M3R35_05320, partial [Candidatus Eremiobacteraeota bacterium]|nr:hypothetical protein [Candidatus Eremiobacteraeota bacterium]